MVRYKSLRQRGSIVMGVHVTMAFFLNLALAATRNQEPKIVAGFEQGGVAEPRYSSRSAEAGSVLAARRAGAKFAARATRHNRAGAITKVRVSVGLMP